MDGEEPPEAKVEDQAQGDGVFLTQGDEQGVDFENEAALEMSVSTRLHRKMAEMKQMDDKLAKMKRDYEIRIRKVKQGEIQFKEKQKSTIAYLRKFKAFIVETDTKRNRAEKKEADERDEIATQTKKFQEKQEKLNILKQQRDKRIIQHEMHKQFQVYLERVVDVTEQYDTIEEIITRHKILDEARVDLQEDSERKQAATEKLQLDLQRRVKEGQNDILMKTSELADLMNKLEEATNVRMNKDNEVVALAMKTKDTTRTYGEVHMSIRNIYARVSSTFPSKRRIQAAEKAAEEASKKRKDGKDEKKLSPQSTSTTHRSMVAAEDGGETGESAEAGGPEKGVEEKKKQSTKSEKSASRKRKGSKKSRRKKGEEAQEVTGEEKREKDVQTLLRLLNVIGEKLMDMRDVVAIVKEQTEPRKKEAGDVRRASQSDPRVSSNAVNKQLYSTASPRMTMKGSTASLASSHSPGSTKENGKP